MPADPNRVSGRLRRHRFLRLGYGRWWNRLHRRSGVSRLARFTLVCPLTDGCTRQATGDGANCRTRSGADPVRVMTDYAADNGTGGRPRRRAPIPV